MMFRGLFRSFEFWSLDIVSDFDMRASNLSLKMSAKNVLCPSQLVKICSLVSIIYRMVPLPEPIYPRP